MENIVYTKIGDKGRTDLFDEKNVPKNHLRVEAYGTIDELNSSLGICKHYVTKKDSFARIEKIQRLLFDIGAELATQDRSILKKTITEEDTKVLEKWIDEILLKIDEPEYFILPGNNKASAYLHLSRTICRRAERVIVSLNQRESISSDLLRFINRLSDWIYSLARIEEDNYKKILF
jgi:cob(I)alamin adenosyltransferase